MSTHETEPTHEEIQELLGVYALDAVDPETAAMVERHLGECVRCSIEVAQHHEVAGLLANSGGASPAELWSGIASQLDGSAPPSWERLAKRLEDGDPPASAPGGRGDGAGRRYRGGCRPHRSWEQAGPNGRPGRVDRGGGGRGGGRGGARGAGSTTSTTR